MITGFNTELRFNDRTIHIQTEEHGPHGQKIQTLIYVGGEILDSVQSDCSDLLKNGQLPDGDIMTKMEEQHKRVVLDIEKGEYDAKIQDGELSVERAFHGRPLLEALLEYLGREGGVETLELSLKEPLVPIFGSELKFSVAARLCISKFPIPSAEMAVSFVSNDQKAVELASGWTDANGIFDCSIALPPRQPGRCSIIVSCVSEYGDDSLQASVLT
ncbi:MAG: hypothetical protein LBC63_02220 [Holophagales bacterium]|jgi:hypothetical protein|nr:hypothetical protein [Holophagales bacterium]